MSNSPAPPPRRRRINHDQNFKDLVLDFPQAALAFFLPQERITLDDDLIITPIRQETTRRRLRHRTLLLDVPLKVVWRDGSRPPLVVLFEFESRTSRFDPHRLHEYVAREARMEKTLRALAVVIFLHRGKISSSMTLAGDHLPGLTFSWVTWQLGAMDARDQADSPNIIARLTSVCMKRPADALSRVHVYGRAVRGLLTLTSDPGLHRKHLDFLEDYLSLDADEWRLFEQLYDMESKHMGAFRERWLEEGRRQGIAQGIEQGVAQGFAQGEQRLLARLLARKFGPLDDATENRLRNASTDEINRWTDQILIARTLDEVFRLQ